MDRIYLIYAELGSKSAPLIDEGYVGAFVMCAVNCEKIEKAIHIARECLAEDGYEIVDIDKCISYETHEWVDYPDVNRAVGECKQLESCVYTEFNCWNERNGSEN